MPAKTPGTASPFAPRDANAGVSHHCQARPTLIPAVGVLREARALYPHNAEALAGRCLHDDPALRTIHHRRAQPFEAAHLGGNVVGLDVYVHAALVLDALDLDDRLVCRCCKHAVIVAAHRMVKVHGTAERGGPEVSGLVHVDRLAVNQHGAQAGVVQEPILSSKLDTEIASAVADPANDPEVALQKKNRGELLRKSLARLSPELADIVGVAEATVKTLCVCRKPRPFDLAKESRNVGHDGRAALLPFKVVGLAVQTGPLGS